MKNILSIILLLIGLLGLWQVRPPVDKVVFLDIGQGDSILLQDGTHQVLLDGGPGKAVLTRLSEELPYFDRTLDVVIATHPDKDHLEGLLHVLEKYPVKLVLLPPVAHTSVLQEEWLRRLIAAAEAKQVAYRFAEVGQQLVVGDIRIAILGPPSTPSFITGKTNNASVLTRVDMQEISLLLTGDAEAAVERELVAQHQAALDVDVLKAGHHGSKTSTSRELLAATTPQLVVISVGKENSYGHPHPTVLERLQADGIPIMRTDQSGSIRFSRERTGWQLSCGVPRLFAPTPTGDHCRRSP